MLRSLYAGVMGLQNEQIAMDVIGNNIANINTVGFKSGRARFAETFSQLISGASPGTSTRGGTNPVQVGLGAVVAGIDNFFTQGNLQTTGLGTDLAIQGNGMFILNDGSGPVYTRDGAFTFDNSGRLVDGITGSQVQGYMADATGNIPAAASLTSIKLPLDAISPANATKAIVMHGNLDATAASGTKQDVTATVYDSLGNKVSLTLEFTKGSANNTWTVAPTAPTTGVAGGTGTLVFKSDGTLDTTNSSMTDLVYTPTNGAAVVTIGLSSASNLASSFSSLSQTAGTTTAFVFSQDGYGAGSLTRTSIDNTGSVVGTFSNGVTRKLAQLGLSRFANSQGLESVGSNGWIETTNSGRAVIGTAGDSAFGTISAGALEGSNVDLAQQFTDLIVAQRGFQANAKIITTGDEMLTDVVNIKR